MNRKSVWYGFCVVMLVIMCSLLFEVMYLTSIAKNIYHSVATDSVVADEENNESVEIKDSSDSVALNDYVNDEFYCPYCDGVLQLNTYSYSRSKAYFSCNCCGYHSPEVKGAIGEEERCKQELKEHFKANDWKKWMDRE